LIDEGCYVGEVIMWIDHVDIQVIGGVKNAADSLRDCQKACLRDPPCKGVDWLASGGTGQKCWLHGPSAVERNPREGITHYDMKRMCIDNGTLVVFL